MTFPRTIFKFFQGFHKKHGVTSDPIVNALSDFLPLLIYHCNLVSCVHVNAIIVNSKHHSNAHSSL